MPENAKVLLWLVRLTTVATCGALKAAINNPVAYLKATAFQYAVCGKVIADLASTALASTAEKYSSSYELLTEASFDAMEPGLRECLAEGLTDTECGWVMEAIRESSEGQMEIFRALLHGTEEPAV